jgi:hypothetical protein
MNGSSLFYYLCFLLFETVNTTFCDRNSVSQVKVMLNWQSTIDENKQTGCVAVFLSVNSSFGNVFEYTRKSGSGDLIRVTMIGRGGRTKRNNNYVLTHNQDYYKNVPMFISAEHKLSIRMLVEDKTKTITYHGLWKCVKWEYSPSTQNVDILTYKFCLVPY